MHLPQDRYADVQNHRVRYWEEGQGAPIVLVHGLGNSVLNWRKNLEPLGKRFRAIALDLPGHGLSDMPRGWFDLPHGAGFLAAFLDELGIPAAHFVGNSMGGILSLELALTQPERVASLTLADSAGLGRQVAAGLRIATLPLVGEYFQRPSLKRVRGLVRWMLYDPRHVDEEELPIRLGYLERRGSAQALIRYLRTGVSPSGQRPATRRDARLASLTQPTLIAWGAQDPLFPSSHARDAAKKIPRAQLHILDRCGHWPQYEYPDEFNRLLTDFVSSVPFPVARPPTVTVP